MVIREKQLRLKSNTFMETKYCSAGEKIYQPKWKYLVLKLAEDVICVSSLHTLCCTFAQLQQTNPQIFFPSLMIVFILTSFLISSLCTFASFLTVFTSLFMSSPRVTFVPHPIFSCPHLRPLRPWSCSQSECTPVSAPSWSRVLCSGLTKTAFHKGSPSHAKNTQSLKHAQLC